MWFIFPQMRGLGFSPMAQRYDIASLIDLLLIDELGYVPFEREATDLLFQLISQRYERRSIALTTNLPFEKWTQVFPDEMTAKAVIDRLVHHGAVFAFSGQRPQGFTFTPPLPVQIPSAVSTAHETLTAIV
jgi:hypothetical protein